MFNIFTKRSNKENNIKDNKKNTHITSKRSFVGAAKNRFISWIYDSLSKINLDIDTQLLTVISRTRELAKNNNIVRSYLELMEKNVIGKAGFTLQSQMKLSDGELNTKLNEILEWEFYEWRKDS